MTGRYETNLEPDIKKMIFVSLAFHVSVFLVFTVKTVFFSADIPKYEPAVRVDLVGLPDKRNPNVPLSVPKPESEKAPQNVKAPDKVETKKIESKTSTLSQHSALNKLKALSAIEKLKAMAEKSKSDKPAAESKSETLKGNAISVGTSLRGLNKIEFDQYIGSLDVHVKNNWSLPEWMLSQGFKAEVLIKIDKSGQIIERRFVKKSGNAEFDERVMAALEKSNPFPAPPDKFTDLVGIQGITFAFPE